MTPNPDQLKETRKIVNELPARFFEDEDHFVGGYVSRQDIRMYLAPLVAQALAAERQRGEDAILEVRNNQRKLLLEQSDVVRRQTWEKTLKCAKFEYPINSMRDLLHVKECEAFQAGRENVRSALIQAAKEDGIEI